jgi:tellurite resistance protein TerC
MEFINLIIIGQPLWMWLTFIGVVLFLLFIDLGVLHRKLHEVSIKESLWMSAFYITIALIFGAWIWSNLGAQSGKEYITGFLIEKTLAMDNVFLISLIFTYFKVPALYQHRVLFWGILGVIVLRAIMIGIGATLIAEFSWVLYIFAVFLIITGIKMLYIGDNVPNIENNPVLKFLRRRLKVTPELHQEKFFVKKLDKETGKVTQWVTPLFVCLILIEITDLVFALDSVPAIFAITTDPYIVYTSNIFAILGLRALYFALSAIIHRFKYLKVSLALILIFIGSKIFIADILGIKKFPANISLGITLVLLLAGVFVSLYKTRPSKAAN